MCTVVNYKRVIVIMCIILATLTIYNVLHYFIIDQHISQSNQPQHNTSTVQQLSVIPQSSMNVSL